MAGLPMAEFIGLSNKQKFELIDGQRVPLLPEVFRHATLRHRLFRHLSDYPTGEVWTKTAYVLLGDHPDWIEGIRIPDISFYAGRRLADYELTTPNALDRPLSLIPDLVAEILVPSEDASLFNTKIDAYLADGVRLIWVFDPQRRKVIIYRPDAEFAQRLSVTERLDGEDILPGFQLDLTRLFE